MENVLEIKGLCKKYDGFSLENVDIALPKGTITGFIGENGAGKSTTIKAILNLISTDAGEIRVFGMDSKTDEKAIKERIGVVLEDGGFPNTFTAENVNVFMRSIYNSWEEETFWSYIERLQVERKKKIKDYSKGMKMKLAIAAALSHHAELLLMDEPTSGLDPIVRDEVLELFYEFLEDENHTVLLSSHITSDLDKIADNIVFIHQGEILLSEEKDVLLESYGILQCTEEERKELDQQAIYAVRKTELHTEALVRRAKAPESFSLQPANIEQIMLFLTRGERVS